MGIEFESEQEQRQTNQLAAEMLEGAADTHRFVGKRIQAAVKQGNTMKLTMEDDSTIFIVGTVRYEEKRESFSTRLEREAQAVRHEEIRVAQERVEGERLMAGSPTTQLPAEHIYEATEGLAEETRQARQLLGPKISIEGTEITREL